MTKKILPILPFLLALHVSIPVLATESKALGAIEVDQSKSIESDEKGRSRWSVEAAIQAHSVAAEASPWVGLSAQYRILDNVKFGMRGFLPVSKSVDSSSYEIQALVRFQIYHGANTDLFFEPDYAENFYKWFPFTSYGLAIGALNRLSADFSVGFMGGVELAHVVLDSYGLEQKSNSIVYPKVALLANFTF